MKKLTYIGVIPALFVAGIAVADQVGVGVQPADSGGLPISGGTLTGHLLFSADNTYDIGASGATRPRTLYVGTSVIVPAAGILSFSSRSQITSDADSSLLLRNAAGTAFSLLKLGGTSASFPALKRNGASLSPQLANDGDASDFLGNKSNLSTTTLNLGTQSVLRRVISTYSWTNAMVVACGAVTTCNISAFSIPAKVGISNMYVVITGAAAGPATVTASVGRTGAAYIDYIVASDAKAAANTVYGDGSAERGTSLTGYDLPSYTGATTVNIQFISGGADLNTVTASAGTIFVEHFLLP